MDKLTAIEAFVRTVDHGSLTAASARLGISRAMVSRLLKELEQRVGARLINRTTRRLALTEPGRVFHQRCSRLLAELDEAEQEVGAAGTRPRGRLRVSAPMTFGTMYLSDLLPEYLAAFPDITLDLVLNDRYVDLVEDGFDLAIRIGRLADSSLVVRKLAPCRIVICASPAYLASRGRPSGPADLEHHDSLLYSFGTLGDAFELNGPEGRIVVRLRGQLRANNGEILAHGGAAGLGIVLGPSFIVADHLRSGELVEIMADWRPPDSGIYAVFPEGRQVSAKVRSLVDFLARRLGPEPPWDRNLGIGPQGVGPDLIAANAKE